MSVFANKLFGLFGGQNRSTSTANNSDKTVQSGAAAGGSFDQSPVVVWEAANDLEAQVIVSQLNSENIPAMIKGEALGTIYGLAHGSLATTAVLVPAPLAEKAIALLEAEYAIEDEDDDMSRENS